MRASITKRSLGVTISWWAMAAALLILPAVSLADAPSAELSRMLPADIGGYHQTQPLKPATTLVKEGLLVPAYFPTTSDTKTRPHFLAGEAEYLSNNGDRTLVEIVQFQTDSEAYSLLTLVARRVLNYNQPPAIDLVDIGTASARGVQAVAFFRGTTFVRVSSLSNRDVSATIDLARLVANTLEKGQDDVPVLVKHLPDFPSAQRQATYAVSLETLRVAVGNQPVLDAVNFDGGAEAVTANYGQAQLAIIEFTTPQFSIDNDQRIWTRIGELKSRGEPTPTAYRRVGNYSVFVFNGRDEASANALVDQVKYEQVVQWLGDDPHLNERLQRYFGQVSAGVLVAVLKSSGLSILLCFAAGALIGAMMFRYRRTQKATAYSDAGGSIRLNLDDLTQPVNTRRLLKSAEPPESRSANS